MQTVAQLLAAVTAKPITFDTEVASAHGVVVDDLRRALSVLAFMGFVERIDRNAHGWAWEPRSPSQSSSRVQELQAELAKPLAAFLAGPVFLDLEQEARSYEPAT